MTQHPLGILFIEEHSDFREAAQELLAALGHRVLAAGGARQALDLLDRRRHEIDLLVVDAYLSPSGGAELVERARDRHGWMPALLLSGFGEDELLKRRAAAAGLPLLPVPFTADQLDAAVDRAWAEPPVAAVPAAPAPSRARRPGWVALAAALGLAAGTAMLARRPAPPLPALPAIEAVRTSAVEPLEPLGELESPPLGLAWRPVPGAASYRVALLGVDGTELWRRQAEAPAVELPEQTRGELRPGVVYYWRVEAFDAAGSRLASSDRARFRLRPGAAAGTGDVP